MKPVIRYIVVNYYSKRDVNGNTYWISEVTSTITGKTVAFTTPHCSNTNAFFHKRDVYYPAIKTVDIQLPIREFNRIEKRVDMHNSCMDTDVAKAIIDLEKE